MIRVVINGISGHMGQAVLKEAAESDTLTVVGGVDVAAADGDIPVVCDPGNMPECDIVVDFSVPKATAAVLPVCIKRRIPILIATTGIDAALNAQIDEAAKTIPVFQSGNMSLGVNLQRALVAQAERTLGSGYDVEIIETHHNRKLDAPSGTALMLADSVKQAMDNPPESYKLGRNEVGRRREQNEIGIHAVRGGSIVGEHQVLFIGENEEIIVTHRVFSRSVFATGAVHAAAFLVGCKPGRYDMDDYVRQCVK